MTQGNAVPESLANFHSGFCYDSRREIRTLASVAGTASRQVDPLHGQYSSSRRKITSLPNNRTNEMIRGCEIRSISGRRPPPRPLHDDSMEHRLVVHRF